MSRTAATAKSSDADNAATARTTASRSVVLSPDQSNTDASAPVASARGNAAATPTRTAGASRSAATGTAARDKLDAAVHTVGRNARVSGASINNDPAVRRAGLSLRPSTAEVGGRATIAGTNVQTGSNIDEAVRSVQTRAATNVVTRESIAEAKELMEQTNELNKTCQQQYNECMDQFCAVIDANQKRCSCSANLSRYTKVESAVKDANIQLNEVAQRIRYVGLSADEIRAIMNATEAEAALSGATDNSETRNMLEDIEKMIKDPTSASSYTATSSDFGLDLDLDFSSGSSDMFSLDFLNSSSTSFSNLRGTELYNAAKKQCKTVLNQCKNAGATSQQISANYDLAIDKDCIAYEQGLTKMNETLASNVRSANLMLQKARLAVQQNKNQYDAKGCISALETCMTDDMVCGADYTKCLDPTKRYIDENGTVVLGQNISDITAFMTNYDNSQIDAGKLGDAYAMTVTKDECAKKGDGSCVVHYLMTKIGTGQKVTDSGLCRAVLNKCQYYTYDSNGNYKPYNDIVVNYVQRAMVNIKAAQYRIISDYASSCMVDVAKCYNQQVSQVNSWSTSASIDSIYRVMSGACHNVALTCAYAVFQNDKDLCSEKDTTGCINNISELFYQSLLCPDNSTYNTTKGTAGTDGYVNERCKCNTGYYVYGTTCVLTCPSGYTQNTTVQKCEK